jgi:hypothetical protein
VCAAKLRFSRRAVNELAVATQSHVSIRFGSLEKSKGLAKDRLAVGSHVATVADNDAIEIPS